MISKRDQRDFQLQKALNLNKIYESKISSLERSFEEINVNASTMSVEKSEKFSLLEIEKQVLTQQVSEKESIISRMEIGSTKLKLENTQLKMDVKSLEQTKLSLEELLGNTSYHSSIDYYIYSVYSNDCHSNYR